MATDPLREEIKIIRSTWPELENLKTSGAMSPEKWSFLIRQMALAYRLGHQNAMSQIQTKVGQA